MSYTINNALRIQQGEASLYLASIQISDLISLAEGLQKPKSNNGLFEKDDDSAQAEIVQALNSSEFANEVSLICDETYDEEKPYQRFLDQVRAQKIADYLNEEGTILPNVIILAVKEYVDVSISTDNNLSKITMESDDPHPVNIIDGQHRVEALRILYETQPTSYKDYEVAVTVLVDAPFYEQAELFAVINGQQKTVNRSQIYDLLGYLPGNKADAFEGTMAVYRFAHRVVKILNQSTKSPWKDQIKMRGIGTGVVSQAAFVDQIVKLMTPRKLTSRLKTYPILYKYYKANDIVGIAKLLVVYFAGIKRASPEMWDGVALKTTLFGKTNGVVVLFLVLHEMLILNGRDGLGIDEVQSRWEKVDKTIISNPPKGGSGGYQQEVFSQVMKEMYGDDWLASFEEHRRPAAQILLDDHALF